MYQKLITNKYVFHEAKGQIRIEFNKSRYYSVQLGYLTLFETLLLKCPRKQIFEPKTFKVDPPNPFLCY
jgi:hypothetical protein